MLKIDSSVDLEMSVHIVLNEKEARALEALSGYGEDAFLRVFYKELGEAYLKPHEEGIRSLFRSIRQYIPPVLSEMNECREFLYVAKKARANRR